MTVYVDNMRRFARVVRGGRTVTGQWSHLLADDAGSWSRSPSGWASPGVAAVGRHAA